jgi:hypothetical protein
MIVVVLMRILAKRIENDHRIIKVKPGGSKRPCKQRAMTTDIIRSNKKEMMINGYDYTICYQHRPTTLVVVEILKKEEEDEEIRMLSRTHARIYQSLSLTSYLNLKKVDQGCPLSLTLKLVNL